MVSSAQLLWFHEARWFTSPSLLSLQLLIFCQKLTHHGGSPLDRVRQSLALESHTVDFLLTWLALAVIPGLPWSLSTASAEAPSLWIMSHLVSELRKALQKVEKVPWQVQSGISLLLGVEYKVCPW